MTRPEWLSLAERIRAAWPRQRLEDATVDQWWRTMRAVDHDAASLALARLVAVSPWMPGLAAIMFEVRDIQRGARELSAPWRDDLLPEHLGMEGLAVRAREYLDRKRGAA